MKKILSMTKTVRGLVHLMVIAACVSGIFFVGALMLSVSLIGISELFAGIVIALAILVERKKHRTAIAIMMEAK